MPWAKSAGIRTLRRPFARVPSSKCCSIDLLVSTRHSSPIVSVSGPRGRRGVEEVVRPEDRLPLEDLVFGDLAGLFALVDLCDPSTLFGGQIASQVLAELGERVG